MTAEPHAARTYRLFALAAEQGADLGAALRALSDDLRDVRRDELRRQATRRRAAMLVPTIAVLAPIMLLFVIAPAAVDRAGRSLMRSRTARGEHPTRNGEEANDAHDHVRCARVAGDPGDRSDAEHGDERSSERGMATAELLGNAALGIAALVAIWAVLQAVGLDVMEWIRASSRSES